MPSAFADRLILRARQLGHPLCVGIDPHLDRIPALFRQGAMRPGDPDTADAVGAFCSAVLARVADRAVAVKPQSAFFEALGAPGLLVLETLLDDARQAGVPVVLDAKRGDIGSTAAGYAAAYLAADAPMRADALTVNPYLGADSLAPFTDAAAASGAGLFVLVRTSNPGGADLQGLPTPDGPVYERVARLLAPEAAKLAGPETGWSALGAVVGAPSPDQARRVRALLPHSLFLVPGYGAQGGSAAEALASFVPGPAGLEGGIVNSSRGILFPAAGESGSARDWEQAVDRALDHAVSELGGAARRAS